MHLFISRSLACVTSHAILSGRALEKWKGIQVADVNRIGLSPFVRAVCIVVYPNTGGGRVLKLWQIHVPRLGLVLCYRREQVVRPKHQRAIDKLALCGDACVVGKLQEKRAQWGDL
eukprot:COSAG01_NODE_381_length_17848_cov_10.220338_16_plen_116_part_00